jgi:hypothetical protein
MGMSELIYLDKIKNTATFLQQFMLVERMKSTTGDAIQLQDTKTRNSCASSNENSSAGRNVRIRFRLR